MFCLIVGYAVAVLPPGNVLAGELAQPVDVKFKAAVDNSIQRYVVMLPKDFDLQKRYDVLVALHGHGSDRWQYVKQSRGECKGARDTAAKHGMIYVSPDYRARTSWMGPKAEADMVQLIGLLRVKYKVGKVFLVGGSMGGTSVLIFAALHPDLVDGVVSENGTANMMEYDKFQDAIAASYGGTKKQRPDEYRKRSPEFAPKKFTMPVAFTVGGKDTVVPPDSVRRLVERLKQAKKKDVMLIDRADGGHSTSYEDTVSALEFVIRGRSHYVRADAKGNGSGEDWTNAYTKLPEKLIRGHTYYVAGGKYPGYRFDDPPSGNRYITIRKATIKYHGTDIGWKDAFGDKQAVFKPLWFSTSYWKFDGVTGAGKNGPSYGFRVARESYHGVKRSQLITIHGPKREGLSFIEIRHAEVPNGGREYDIPQYNIYALGGSNITVADNYVYNGSSNMLIRSWKNCIIERNYFGGNWSSPSNHGCQVSTGGVCLDVLVRYNVFEDSLAMALDFHKATNARWKVTGNVVIGGRMSNGAFGNGDSATKNVVMDCEFHNNTFVRVTGGGFGSGIFIGTGNGNTAFNNLWYKCSRPHLRTVNTHDYNSFIDCSLLDHAKDQPYEPHVHVGKGDPFVDSAKGDFRLKAPSEPGKKGLGPPHDKDMDGQARGADGVADRGAFDFMQKEITK